MSTLYDRSTDCAICGVTFSSKKIKRSAIAVGRRDEDYCPYYKGDNPIYYGIFVCPSCGFSSFETEFDGVKRLSNRFKETFRKNVTTNWRGQKFGEERSWADALETYKLALITYTSLEYKKSVLAKVCLRVAWLYRYKNKSKKELIFMKYARDYFIDAYENENLASDKENELLTMLLVGELSKRLGDYEQAIMWFDKLLKDKDVKKKRHIEVRAREAWGQTSEAYKALKNQAQ